MESAELVDKEILHLKRLAIKTSYVLIYSYYEKKNNLNLKV